MAKIKLSDKALRRSVYDKTSGFCAYCGCVLEFEYGFQIDHVIPKRRYKYPEPTQINGSDHIDNLMPCCASCNACKSDLSLEDFRYRIYDRVERLQKYSSEYNLAKRFGLVAETKTEVVFFFEKYKPVQNG